MTSFIGLRPRPQFFLKPLEIVSRPLVPVSTALVRYHESVHTAEAGTVWPTYRSTTSEEDQTERPSSVKANPERNEFQNQVPTYMLRYLELAYRLLLDQRKQCEWVLITAEDALQSQPLDFSDSQGQQTELTTTARTNDPMPSSPPLQRFVSSSSSDSYFTDSIKSDFDSAEEEAKQVVVSSTRVSSSNSTSDVSTRRSSIWDDIEDAHDEYEDGTDTSGFTDNSPELKKTTLEEEKNSWDDDLDSLFDGSVASFDEDFPDYPPDDLIVSSPESEQERTITLTLGLTAPFNSAQPLSPIQSCVTADGTTTPPCTPPTHSILRSPQAVSRTILTTTPPKPPIFNPAVAAPRSTFTFTPPSKNLPTIFTPCPPARAGPGPLHTTRLRRVSLASTPRSTTTPTSASISSPSPRTPDSNSDSDGDSPPAPPPPKVLITRAHTTPHAIHRRRPSHPALLTLEAENAYLKAKLQQSESVDLYLRKILVHTFSEKEIHKDKSTRLTRQAGKLKDVILWLIRKKGKLSAELGLAREDVEEKQREIEALVVQIEGVKMREERDELCEELGGMGLEMRSMSEELEGEREKIARQQEELACQKDDVKTVRGELESQKMKLTMKREDLAREREETHALRKRVRWLEDWVDGLHEERTWMREERQVLLSEKEERQKEIQMLVEGYERLEGVVEGVVGRDSWREETDMEDEEGLEVIEEEGEEDDMGDAQNYPGPVMDGELIVRVENVRDSLEGLRLGGLDDLSDVGQTRAW